MDKLIQAFEKESLKIDGNLLKILKIVKNNNNNNTKKEIPNATPIHISVKSACCELNRKLNLNEMAKVIYNLMLVNNGPNYKFQGIEYKDIFKNNLKNNESSSQFYNSCTVVVKISNRYVNLKLFTNGSISMTGCKDDEDGEKAVKIFIEEMNNYDNIYNDHKDELLEYSNYRITMINGDYSIGYGIIREDLFDILKTDYKLFVTYEAIRYPGVKVSFMWNINNSIQNGICNCQKYCVGKGKKYDGNGEGRCKKVTIAIFQSGKIIINGSKSLQQTNDAYNYINIILNDNYDKIIRYSIIDCLNNDYKQ